MKRQQGVALVAAIFIVVIIGAALLVMATLSVRTSEQTTQNLLQIRAQFAANAAIEERVQRLTEGNEADCSNGTASSSTISVPAYSEFTVTLDCLYSDYNRPAQQIRLFELSAVAEYSSPDNPDYVWAEVNASVEQ